MFCYFFKKPILFYSITVKIQIQLEIIEKKGYLKICLKLLKGNLTVLVFPSTSLHVVVLLYV